MSARNLSNAFGKLLLVDSSHERNGGDGVFFQARRCARQVDITRCLRPFQIAGERHAYDGADTTEIQRIALDDDDRAAVAWSRSDRFTQIGPPNVSL